MGVCLCPLCQSETTHEYGLYKAIEINGRLFDAESSLSSDVEELSNRFKDYVISEKSGELSLDILRTFLQQQMQAGSNPLSKMFANRIRAKKCRNCGHLIKLSRLP